MVVDVDETMESPVPQVAHDPGQFLQLLVLRLDDLVPDLAGALLDFLPVGAMQPDHDRLCQFLPEQPVQPEYRRHVVSLQEDMAQPVLGEIVEIGVPQVIRIPDLDAIAVAFRQPLAEGLEQVEEVVQSGHLQLVQVFELEHQRADMVAQRFDGLEESLHQADGEEMRIGDKGGAFLLAVMMGEGDAVRHLDAEEKARRHRGGVFPHDLGPGQKRRVALEEGPEPLVDLDGGIAPAVFLKIVAAMFAGIDQALPGFVFPAACADSDQIRRVHALDYKYCSGWGKIGGGLR